MVRFSCAALALTTLAALPAMAAAPVPIGIVTTLSGAGGYLGEDMRDGFKIAVAEENGALGGVPIKLLVEDDGLKPGNARQIAERYLTSEKVKILTGIVFSNIAEAVVPQVMQYGAFYISSNAGPANFAGKGCNKNYFVVSYQTDTLLEAAGEYANRLGYKRMFLIVPNYQAGKDAITGFKRTYKGEVAGELYTQLDQTDFSAEIAQIRAAKPQALFMFEPGGFGITFIKQYAQAGLADSIPIVAHAADAHMIGAVGDVALGLHAPASWNMDFDNAANRRFTADFVKAYGREPTYFAAYGYDVARLIASALKAVDGDMDKTDAFRAALRKADFASVRGSFKFAENQHPILDWYGTDVIKDSAGKLQTKTTGRILSDYGDSYAQDCKM